MPELGPFASPSDYAECRRLHRMYGATYYFSTLRLPVHIRPRVHALYAFVRVPDEWVDNPRGLSIRQQRERLRIWRQEFRAGLEGIRPENAVLRAFCDAAIESQIPLEEPMAFLDAMEHDLDTDRYETYDDLKAYMRGSAAAVGVMMCYVLGAAIDEETLRSAMALGEAMQLTNFLRDIGEDAARGRIYIPLEDLKLCGVSESEIQVGVRTGAFMDLMRFEIERARTLYSVADSGIERLPESARKGVRLASALYSRILNRIEQRDYDVFGARIQTTKAEKLAVAARLFFG